MNERDFLQALREALHGRPPFRELPLPPPVIEAAALLHKGPTRYASVLIPLYEAPEGVEAVFLRRSETFGLHRGQIAFPGGGREPMESDLDCALREAQEEVALDPRQVRVLGRLDPCPTNTGFVVSPFVAHVATPPSALRPDPREVDSIFSVPVRALLAPGCLREAEGPSGMRLDFFVHGEEVIWGATGRMLRQLLELATGTRLVPRGEVPWHKVRY